MSPHVPTKIKPKLRGVSHYLGFCISLATGTALLASPQTGEGYVGGLVYAASLSLSLGISALYHRPMWSYGARRILRRVDHSGIFFLIAGTYTAFWAMAPQSMRSTVLLWVMWGSSMAGVVGMSVWTDGPRMLRAAVYVVLGLSTLPLAIQLPGFVGWLGTFGVLGGGAIYIAGAAVYARRWPNPDPRVFGYHEVFHVMVLLAAGLHFAVVFGMHWRTA